MGYEINRLEKTKDRNNNLEVFVDIHITDDLGTYPFGHWLTLKELEEYLVNESEINSIMDKYLISARNLKLVDIEASKIEFNDLSGDLEV